MFQKKKTVLLFFLSQVLVIAIAGWFAFNLLPQPVANQPTPSDVPTLVVLATIAPSATYAFPSIEQQETWAAEAQTLYPVSATQYAAWTETARPPTIDPNGPTIAPWPEWLAPSDEWVRYTHPLYGYSFEYPSNWSISEEYLDDGVSVVNYDTSLGGPAPKDSNGIDRLSLSFGPLVPIDNQTLEQFVANYLNSHSLSDILSEENSELANGYKVIEVKVKVFVSYDGFLIVFVTNGDTVGYFSAVDLKSQYIGVTHHVLDSFVIP